MAVEALLAESTGVAERGPARARVRRALERFDLPITIPEDLAADDLLEAMRGDKKVRAGARPLRAARADRRDGPCATDGAWTVEVGEDKILQAMAASR